MSSWCIDGAACSAVARVSPVLGINKVIIRIKKPKTKPLQFLKLLTSDIFWEQVFHLKTQIMCWPDLAFVNISPIINKVSAALVFILEGKKARKEKDTFAKCEFIFF